VKFSIIIPFKEMNEYVRESVRYIFQLRSTDWELLLVPNEPFECDWRDDRVRVLPSGHVGPAAKRDIAAATARGEILVFLDDDSYPRADLLDVAAHHFKDLDVVALGGPGITPPQDTFWQHVSGAVFLSHLSGGAPERYVPIGDCHDVEDWPSVNLMVRRDDFLEVGGFDSPYWPGEDTKLCLHLIKKTGRRILYVPELVVWHHRRGGLRGHLRQVGGYGLHRGFFVKRYPETSRKVRFFGPSTVVLLASLSLFLPVLPHALALGVGAGWLIYGTAMAKALWDFARHERVSVALCALGFTFCTHLVYGVRFLQGLLFTKRLVSTLR
jgi:hypothetical protein